jgi:hypothetical protein
MMTIGAAIGSPIVGQPADRRWSAGHAPERSRG